VAVRSPDNRGKYTLAVGEKEEFPPAEVLRTLVVLPRLKREFFGRPAWTAYFNLVGLFIAVPLVLLVSVGVVVSKRALDVGVKNPPDGVRADRGRFVRHRAKWELVYGDGKGRQGTDDLMAEGRRRVKDAGTLTGPLWFGGWLFTIAFAKLLWWQAILGIIIWPYYLGLVVR